MTAPFAPRFARTVDLYGGEAFARLRGRGACVAGLGGVGAHCATALARSGVGRLLLIDFDRLTVSSLNRHPVAAARDVGRLKTEILADWIAAVCPDTAVETATLRLDPARLDQQLPAARRPDLPVLIDCIDDVAAKAALLVHGVRHGWRVLSSMGAAGKRDGGQVRRGDLFATSACPLAREIRRRLRRLGIGPDAVEAVWSTETPVPPVVAPAGPDGRQGGHDEPGGGTPRRQPSNQMLPGIFGYALAARAVQLLCERPASR